MRKLKSEDIQEGRVFHNAGQSVRVLRTEVIESQSSSLQVVFFQDVSKNTGTTGLPIDLFRAQYKRKKRKI